MCIFRITRFWMTARRGEWSLPILTWVRSGWRCQMNQQFYAEKLRFDIRQSGKWWKPCHISYLCHFPPAHLYLTPWAPHDRHQWKCPCLYRCDWHHHFPRLGNWAKKQMISGRDTWHIHFHPIPPASRIEVSAVIHGMSLCDESRRNQPVVMPTSNILHQQAAVWAVYGLWMGLEL